MRPPSAAILGQRVDAVSLDQAVSLVVERSLAGERGSYVCLTNVHSTVESQKDARLRAAVEGSYLSVPDGAPLVWILRRRGWKHTQKVTGIDFIPRVARAGLSQGVRHFFYGGGDGIAERAAEGLTRLVPGTVIAGAGTPPFTQGYDWDLAPLQAELERTRPHILWVGLGAPKQELWMDHAAQDLNVPISLGVGAAFDFLAGAKPAAPRWLSTMGLEWLYRLASEPTRLWRRYLIGNPRFVYLLMAERFGRNPTKVD